MARTAGPAGGSCFYHISQKNLANMYTTDVEQTNEELIASYQDGNEEAFAQLTRRTIGAVYSFVRRFVGNEEDTQDIVQETYVKAWKGLHTYNEHTSKFNTWLMRIARNTAIDHLRKKKHVPLSYFDTAEGKNVLEETVPDPEPLPEELLLRSENAKTIRNAIDSLPEAQRTVLLLHYTNHLTFQEIGEVLGEPENTVKSRHHRALITLRRLLSAHAPTQQL